MSCSQRINEKYRDLDVVRILAKKAANALSVDMIIYKTICDGTKIYKFSEDWKGQAVEIVRYDGKNTSASVLPNTSDFRSLTIKSKPGKTGTGLE